MKGLSIFGVLCVVSGVIATADVSNDEAERRESMKSLLKNLCDNHHLQAHFDDGHYSKLFDALKSQRMAILIKNKTTFEERLEYVYNAAADREKEIEPHCLHTCIKNETYTDCLKTNIFITMLFHNLHCNSHVHDGLTSAKIGFDQQINLWESGLPKAGKMYGNRLIKDLQRFLKIVYHFNQTRNPHEESVASIDTSNIYPDRSFEEDLKSSNSDEINKSALVNDDGTVPQLTKDSSEVDIIFERGIRVQRGANDKNLQPTSAQIKNGLDVTSNGIIEDNANFLDHLDENSISPGISSFANFKELEDPTTITLITTANLENISIPSEQIISNIPPSVKISMEAPSNHEYPTAFSDELKSIIKKEERDVSSLENEHMNVSHAEVLESISLNSISLLENETEISYTEAKKEDSLNDLETIIEENVTANLSTLLFEKVKFVEKESNLTELVFENVTMLSHDKEKSKVIVEGPNKGNKTGSNHENLTILNKDVKVDNKAPKVKNGSTAGTSCSESCSDQHKTFENAMDVSNTSSRLVFGITALLIVLGLVAGAVAISCYVLEKDESPTGPRRQRSSMNINQPSQSKG